MMVYTRRIFLILFMAEATISSSLVPPASIDIPEHHGDVPVTAAPRAHELDNSYTFDQYLTHFGKRYYNPVEYAHRSRIFSKNLKKILAHNVGKMDENGDILHATGGYVMGVNMFTDIEQQDMPMGYNKMMHPSWRVQLKDGKTLLKTERFLDGSASYSVSKNM